MLLSVELVIHGNSPVAPTGRSISFGSFTNRPTGVAIIMICTSNYLYNLPP